MLLTWSVGLPYFALSATSPLVQAWFSRSCPGPFAIPAVRVVELWLAGGAVELSVRVRAGVRPAEAVGPVVGGLLGLRRVVCRDVSPACGDCGGRGLREAGSEDLEDAAGPVTWADRLCWLALAGVGVADALGGHEPYLSGRGRRAVSLGDAPGAVLVVVHHLFRSPPLVRSLALGVGGRHHAGRRGRRRLFQTVDRPAEPGARSWC